MNKQVSVLAVIAILAVALAVWLNQSVSKNTFEVEVLFDDLQEFANQLENVEIKNAQGVLFSAQKSGENWLATYEPEQPAYPVSQEKLANFVATMTRVKLIEAKTSKPKNYSRLGLQSIDKVDSMAHLVTFKTNNKTWQVLIGNKVSLGEGQYILKPHDPQSWRTDKTISLPIDKVSWLKPGILPYQAQDIRSVARVDSQQWQIERAANGDFQLINLPKGNELEYPSILNSIASNLTNLHFKNILVFNDDVAQSLKILTQLEVVTTDNKIFKVVVSELEDQHFVHFIAGGQTEYWQQGYYLVTNFSAQQLIKNLDDFLAEQNPPTISSETKPKTVDEGESPF